MSPPLPRPEEPTRIIDLTRLHAAVRAVDDAMEDLEKDPSMERAMLVAVAESVLRVIW